jgi:all-trans-retinol dehydrogenase (NAD+)
MSQIAGSTILVTGAGSGLGRRMSIKMADMGARMVLWDINREAIDKVRDEIATASAEPPFADVCDVSNRHEVYAAAERAKSAVGPVDILVNNAGIVSGRDFLECSDEQIERTMGVNTMSLFWTAKAFLPAMIERDRGHIVTLASSAGYVGVAKLADYCASKWAAVGFDESLRVEFKKSKRRLKTTVVCPFFINTGMFDGVKTRFPLLLPILDEKKVVDRIVRAIEKDQPRLSMPWMVRTVPLMKFLPPSIYDAVANFLGVNSSMDEFVGRSRKS